MSDIGVFYENKEFGDNLFETILDKYGDRIYLTTNSMDKEFRLVSLDTVDVFIRHENREDCDYCEFDYYLGEDDVDELWRLIG